MAVVVFGTLFLSSCGKAPEIAVPSVTAIVDRDSITVGDRIGYSVRAAVGADVPFVLEEHQGAIGPFTILESDFDESEEDGSRIAEHRYTLTAFSTGLHGLGPAVLKYGEEGKEELSASPIEVEVYSVLGETPELKDIQGPVGLLPETGFRRYLLIGLAIAAVVLLCVFLYLRRRRRVLAPAPPPVLSPCEMACRELEAIRALDLVGQGMIKEYYTRICDVLRRYVEGAFGISAPEMTTDEFLDAAAVSGALGVAHRDLLQVFLNQCDLVKFARYRATRDEAESIYGSAERFVQETAPRPAAEKVTTENTEGTEADNGAKVGDSKQKVEVRERK